MKRIEKLVVVLTFGGCFSAMAQQTPVKTILATTGEKVSYAQTSSNVVADEAAMLALPARIGDVAVQSSTNKTFILKLKDASALASWVEIKAPSSGGTVTSVTSELGTTGTDIDIAVTTGTTTPLITLNIPTASAANRGALSAADWTIFNDKEPAIAPGTAGQYYTGEKNWATLDKAAVGLGNVDNTSDLLKPISTAAQAALDDKAPINAPVLTGDAQAVTPAAGDSDTSIATTAFVADAITAGMTTGTTNTLTMAVNTLSSTVNGKLATADIVTGVSNTLTGTKLTTTVNGVEGAAVDLAVALGTTVTEEFTAVDGQIDFTLTTAPTAGSKIKFYINGVRIENAITLAGSKVSYDNTKNLAYELQAGDLIVIDYLK